MNAEFWIIITAVLLSIPCAVLGSFLVLRRSVMVADAISHAVLPGIVIAYVMSSEVDTFTVFAGASIFGIITTFLIELLSRKINLQQDASIGVVFTFLFSLGLVLISVLDLQTELEPDHILFGEILNVPFNVLYINNTYLGPKAIWVLGILNIIILSTTFICYKKLMHTSFDSAFMGIIGTSVMLWHYILMSMVSITTIGAFDIVGAILVIALLALPATTAYLWTNYLKSMIGISILIGIGGSIGGYYFSKLLNTSTSGSIVLILFFFFLSSVIITNLKKRPERISN